MAAWSEQGHGGGAGQALVSHGDIQNGDGTTPCPSSGGAMDGGGRRVQLHIIECRLRRSGDLGRWGAMEGWWSEASKAEGLGGAEGKDKEIWGDWIWACAMTGAKRGLHGGA